MPLPRHLLGTLIATISPWLIPAGLADIIKLADNREIRAFERNYNHFSTPFSRSQTPSAPFNPFSATINFGSGFVSQTSTTEFNNIEASARISEYAARNPLSFGLDGNAT